MKDNKPSVLIIKRAKEIAKEYYMKQNPNTSGWEDIEDMSKLLFEFNMDQFLILAMLDFLDGKLYQEE